MGLSLLENPVLIKTISQFHKNTDQIARRFIGAKPVLHVTAAILAIGLLPLIPPVINQLFLGPYDGRTKNINSPPEIPCVLNEGDKDYEQKISSGAHRNCAESLLALGHKLNLSSISQTDLELLPGISSRLSAAIIKDRDKILEDARELEVDRRYQALQRVKGIGEAISLRLNELIAITPQQKAPGKPMLLRDQ